MKFKYKKQKAFSIAETMVTIMIISVILAAAFPVVSFKKFNVGPFWVSNASGINSNNSGGIGIFNYNPSYGLSIGDPNNGNDQTVFFSSTTGGSEPTTGGYNNIFMWDAPKNSLRIGHSNYNSYLGGYDWDSISPQSIVIGGDKNNVIGTGPIVSIGGFDNPNNMAGNSGANSFIFVGEDNALTGANSFVAGGELNTISQTFAGILGAESSSANATGTQNFLAGGSSNTITGTSTGNSVTLGGYGNTISTGLYNSCLGSKSNTITSSQNGLIAGSQTSSVSGSQSAAIGALSTSVSGNNSVAFGTGASSVTLSGSNSVMLGVLGGTLSGSNSVLAGYNGKNTAANSLLFDDNSGITLSVDKSVAFGTNNFYTKTGVLTPWASDARLKNIMGHYNKGLQEITHLNLIKFRYKNMFGFDSKKINIGMLAQNVIKFFPQAKMPAAIGKGYLDYDILPVQYATINAVKELHHKNEELKLKNQELARKNKALEARIYTIRKTLNQIN